LLEELSLLEAPSPSPTAEASSPSLPKELSSLEALSPSLTAVALGPIVVASSLIVMASSPSSMASRLTIVVTSPSEMSPHPFRTTSPQPPFRPSTVVLKYASTCPFIRIEGSTISDLPLIGVLYWFLASLLMPS